ncbi:hypothetical protein A3K34_04675 [candidate division WWE3 bacterium RIFOXYC1_FULL_40_10]|uniref:Uncharacterized protein n=1 Tax=candidate division WWE3 bacterium RIFOXYA2_FULL_46_9 TaxID=1802636 RepID=A0A1F4W158_UNCKA|nr:MAG: hypothetical protein A3K58_04675 [candidate division WWE3 bacterium RIFOXYB1_FULL_40_22]OGC62133.1 MAG: hypothetical protein A3K37_04675 [candidate division WWE3 bacterium RIFOXYA1_FULL_40_11]OGC63146.1 MAG: hypothetical protein A2264_00420 [candidate division WWE3 bacterium RIFOXYA2_FULL_46_9]OGC64924.1 MAG: hypothetical protein A2326_02690 [candidate division WWE3 bacterium RIFOXYB2_FULL_41_6]OGC66516.1 MAG: hypothetical protein A3K34_04675 [candidate division WWE3 bacterium RIFOXYC1_
MAPTQAPGSSIQESFLEDAQKQIAVIIVDHCNMVRPRTQRGGREKTLSYNTFYSDYSSRVKVKSLRLGIDENVPRDIWKALWESLNGYELTTTGGNFVIARAGIVNGHSTYTCKGCADQDKEKSMENQPNPEEKFDSVEYFIKRVSNVSPNITGSQIFEEIGKALGTELTKSQRMVIVSRALKESTAKGIRKQQYNRATYYWLEGFGHGPERKPRGKAAVKKPTAPKVPVVSPKQETTHTNNRSSLVVDHNGPIEISWPDGIITVKGKVVITLLSVLVISIASFLLF